MLESPVTYNLYLRFHCTYQGRILDNLEAPYTSPCTAIFMLSRAGYLILTMFSISFYALT